MEYRSGHKGNDRKLGTVLIGAVTGHSGIRAGCRATVAGIGGLCGFLVRAFVCLLFLRNEL